MFQNTGTADNSCNSCCPPSARSRRGMTDGVGMGSVDSTLNEYCSSSCKTKYVDERGTHTYMQNRGLLSGCTLLTHARPSTHQAHRPPPSPVLAQHPQVQSQARLVRCSPAGGWETARQLVINGCKCSTSVTRSPAPSISFFSHPRPRASPSLLPPK